MPPAKKSEVWNHFTITDNRAKCCYCSLNITYNPNMGTGNLARHLKRKHFNVSLLREISLPSVGALEEVACIETITPDDVMTIPSTSVDTVQAQEPETSIPIYQASQSNSKSDYIVTKNPLSVHRAKQVDSQLLKLISRESLPFSIVEDPEFRNLINLLCPTYKIPTKKTISFRLPAVHNELKGNVQAFEPGTAVCLTVDGWTSQNNLNHFYAVRAHFIDENTTLQNVLLDCINYEETHIADNISTMLRNVVLEWGLQNVTAIVTDNTSNILSAVKNLGWRQVTCMAHSINLAVNNGLQQQEIKTVITKVKNIVEHFQSSSDALLQLQENQLLLNLPTVKLKQNCAAHWNSTYDMLTTFYEVKDAIITTLAIANPGLNDILVEEWEIIAKCIEVLQIFCLITEALCSENHVSLSMVPIYVSSILDYLNTHISKINVECVTEMCKMIKKEIFLRFGNVETQELIVQATLLDPRIKQHGLSSTNAGKAVADLKKMCAKVKINNDKSNDLNANSGEHHAEEHEPLLWGKFDEKVKNLIAPKNPTAASILEVDTYLNESLLDRRKDHLIWWKQRKYVYPRLYKLMLKYMCIAATSVHPKGFSPRWTK